MGSFYCNPVHPAIGPILVVQIIPRRRSPNYIITVMKIKLTSRQFMNVRAKLTRKKVIRNVIVLVGILVNLKPMRFIPGTIWQDEISIGRVVSRNVQEILPLHY